MAEKTDWPHTLIVALTYAESTQEGRDGARMFCYADVRAFFARVRAALKRLHGDARLRFICAGEQGDRTGRCHWHLALYSNVDLTQIGEVLGYPKLQLGPRKKVRLTDRADLLTVGKDIRRLNWSLWPLGFVTFQEADQGGMHYVLSYCLKDQFTNEKSIDTMREAKAENFATGLFRMSKRPAIGENFLMRKMEALHATGSVLPALKIKVPGFHGYWQPNGSFRKKLLWCLVALNKCALWTSGAPAPQWSSLVASCIDNNSDLEILNGPQEENDDDASDFESELAARQRQAAGLHREREFIARCAGSLPCTDCLHTLSREQLLALGVERYEIAGVWSYASSGGQDHVTDRQRRQGGGLNPYCQQAGSKIARFALPRTGGKAP